MRRWVKEILRRYGQEVTLERGEGTRTVRAFLQPVVERDENGPAITAVGRMDGRLWLYLGQEAAESGDILVWNGQRFRVRSGRPHYLGARLSHWRAVLERAREAE